MSDQTNGLTLKKRKSRHDGRIITELPVPMDLGEVRTIDFHVIEKVGALGIAREFDLFVGRKMFHLEWLLTQANCVGSTDPFNVFHKFAVRRDFHVRIGTNQRRIAAGEF